MTEFTCSKLKYGGFDGGAQGGCNTQSVDSSGGESDQIKGDESLTFVDWDFASVISNLLPFTAFIAMLSSIV